MVTLLSVLFAETRKKLHTTTLTPLLAHRCLSEHKTRRCSALRRMRSTNSRATPGQPPTTANISDRCAQQVTTTQRDDVRAINTISDGARPPLRPLPLRHTEIS